MSKREPHVHGCGALASVVIVSVVVLPIVVVVVVVVVIVVIVFVVAGAGADPAIDDDDDDDAGSGVCMYSMTRLRGRWSANCPCDARLGDEGCGASDEKAGNEVEEGTGTHRMLFGCTSCC